MPILPGTRREDILREGMRSTAFRPLCGGAIALLSFHPVIAQISAAAVRRSGQHTVAAGPQYDSTHVYRQADDFKAFISSFVATLGGNAVRRIESSATPVTSSTEFQAVRTPVGVLSVFAYRTPIPFPFGEERTGYLVTDM